jgi:hypothetical protein
MNGELMCPSGMGVGGHELAGEHGVNLSVGPLGRLRSSVVRYALTCVGICCGTLKSGMVRFDRRWFPWVGNPTTNITLFHLYITMTNRILGW